MTVTLVLELLFPVNINILLGWSTKTRIKDGKIPYVEVQKESVVIWPQHISISGLH